MFTTVSWTENKLSKNGSEVGWIVTAVAMGSTWDESGASSPTDSHVIVCRTTSPWQPRTSAFTSLRRHGPRQRTRHGVTSATELIHFCCSILYFLLYYYYYYWQTNTVIGVTSAWSWEAGLLRWCWRVDLGARRVSTDNQPSQQRHCRGPRAAPTSRRLPRRENGTTTGQLMWQTGNHGDDRWCSSRTAPTSSVRPPLQLHHAHQLLSTMSSPLAARNIASLHGVSFKKRDSRCFMQRLLQIRTDFDVCAAN